MSKKVKQLVPELRFSEFEEPLNLNYLGEILDFKNGINADKSQYGSGKKFINVLDIINDAPIYHDSIIGSVDITEKEFEKNNVIYGDILFQRSSEIREEAGQSNIYLDKNQEATFGGFVIRGRPKVSFNPIYFNYLLKTSSIRKEITNRSGGSTRFNVGQNSLSQVPILICESATEQEKIASFLDAIALRITQLRRKHKLLETYKKGVMQKIFSQQIRFPKYNKNWKQLRIENVASVSSGGTPSRTEPAYWNGDIPWVTTSEIGDLEIFDTTEKITKKGLENSSAKIFKKNTILMAMYGQGKTRGQVSILRIDASTNQACAAITLKHNDSPEFVYYFLLKEYERLRTLSNDGSQKNLSAGLIKQYKIPLTSLEEQEKIASFLDAIKQKIDAVAFKIEAMKKFKKGLLQKMFV